MDKDQDGSNVPFVPNYMANLGVTFSLPCDITISPYVRFVGSYYDSTSEKRAEILRTLPDHKPEVQHGPVEDGQQPGSA